MQARSIGFTFSALALVVACSAAPATAATVTFASRAAFDALFPGVPLEDFEEANVGVGSFGLMSNPLDSATNNAIFSPGDILGGLRLTAGPSAAFDPNNIFIAGPGFATYVSRAVSYNGGDTTTPQITISFYNNDVAGFGLDLTSNPNGNTVSLTLFSGATNLGTFPVLNVQGAGTFFGAYSTDPSQPITRVELTGANFFGVDNIAFGQTVIPEPATLSLLAAGLFGVRRARRSRRA